MSTKNKDNNSSNNKELKKIYKYTPKYNEENKTKIINPFNEEILYKNKVVNFKTTNLTNILKEIKVKSEKNSTKNLTHFLKFNSMYFSNNENRSGYTRKFYEVITTFIMMLEIIDTIKVLIKDYVGIQDNTSELSKDIQITENINMSSVVFDKDSIDSVLFQKNIKPFFGSSLDSIKKIFNRYKNQRGLLTLSDHSISNITLFETLFRRYNNNERLAKIIPGLMNQYNVFKSKIVDILCDNENKDFDFGLLGFGFLFAYEFFPNITSDIEINTFLNKKLYDMSIKNINIEDEINNIKDIHNKIGLKMASSIKYFYENEYRTNNFYKTLLEALDLDVYGLKFALFYIHPKFLEIFLKRKYKIDKQLYNYLSSYDIKLETQTKNTFDDPTSKFINPANIFFSDYDTFISK